VIVCGGMPSRDQRQAIENGAHVVVGTPGRVLDLLERGVLDLRDVGTLVLDEADKMLEMGFEEEVEAILQAVPTSRQTVFFSATFPERIEALSKSYQKNPVMVKVEDVPETMTIAEFAYEVEGEKFLTLLRVLQQHPGSSTIVFCNHKANIAEICERLGDLGVDCGALHGDLEQRDRDRVMAMFRNGSYRILVATDVAGRGLDIDHLDVVVNYDFPHGTESYVHRIGRTGRAGRSGVAVSLYLPEESSKVFEVSSAVGRKFEKPKLGFAGQYGIAPDLREAPMRTLSISGGRKDKLRPGDILGALTGESGGLEGREVGKIEVHDHITYVAVAKQRAKQAVENLRDGRIKKQKFRIRLEE
jgi:ATP-independent RNA helicase DbpA